MAEGKTSQGNENRMKEQIYEELGANYRFFLRWRHAALAGTVIAFGAILSFTFSLYTDVPEIAWCIPAAGSPLGILMWIIDVRNRSLYHAAIDSGEEIERSVNITGFYSQLRKDEIDIPKGTSVWSRLNQSLALNIVFWGTSLLSLGLSIWLFIKVH